MACIVAGRYSISFIAGMAMNRVGRLEVAADFLGFIIIDKKYRNITRILRYVVIGGEKSYYMIILNSFFKASIAP